MLLVLGNSRFLTAEAVRNDILEESANGDEKMQIPRCTGSFALRMIQFARNDMKFKGPACRKLRDKERGTLKRVVV
jgi:hypothetical protein